LNKKDCLISYVAMFIIGKLNDDLIFFQNKRGRQRFSTITTW